MDQISAGGHATDTVLDSTEPGSTVLDNTVLDNRGLDDRGLDAALARAIRSLIAGVTEGRAAAAAGA
jgi:hypothetical protein